MHYQMVCRNWVSKLSHEYFFDTIQVKIEKPEKLRQIAEDHKMNFFYDGKENVRISIGENSTQRDILDILSVFSAYLEQDEASIIFDYDRHEEIIPVDTEPKFSISDPPGF